MLKKISTVIALAVAFTFAQDAYAPAPTEETQYEDMSQYTSGAPAPETPVVNINETKGTDPVFSVSIHPLTLLFWWALFDEPYITLTIEGCIGSNWSVITRPEFIYLSSETDLAGYKEDLSIYGIGITEGLRYYFGAHHKGLYVEPEFMYTHVGLDYEYSGSYEKDNTTASANAFGGALVIGYKILSGSFVMGSDIGFLFQSISAKGENEDDVEEISTSGMGFTGNIYMGYSF